jgi:type I restriction enzyme S subunit
MNKFPLVSLETVIAEAVPGFASGDRDVGGIIQVRMNNVSTEGKLTLTDLTRVPSSQKNLPKYFLAQGDVLFNSTNSPKLVGKAAVFRGHTEPIVFSNHFLRLRVQANKLDPSYLVRWLNMQWQRGVFEGMCTQWVNQASVKKERLLALEIPLPPLAEQQRIAALLDKATALREKRRQSLAKLDTLLQSVFLEMFGYGTTHPSICLSKLCGFITKGTTPKSNDIFEQADETSIPFLKVYHIANDGSIDFDYKPSFVSRSCHETYLSRSKVYPGDVLMNIVGPPLGKIGLVSDAYREWNINQALAIFRPDRAQLDSWFLLYALRSQLILPGILKLAVGIRQQNLSLEQCRNIEIFLPPIEQQQKFGKVAKKIWKLKDQNFFSLSRLEEVFQSLQQRAFTGELFAAEARAAVQQELFGDGESRFP